jgi:uncharacterized membrane protein YraQ (UPF0718 family)
LDSLFLFASSAATPPAGSVEAKVLDFILVFTSILYEALPFIILGAVIAGFLEELVPQQMIARFIPRSRPLAIAMGCVLGLIFPMCECGIIPVMRRLLRKGLPLSCCVSYMLAGPIINVVVMLSTYAAFARYEPWEMGRAWMVSMRVGLGFLVAFVTGLIVEWQHRKLGSRALLAPLALPDEEKAPVKDENGDDEQPEPRPFVQRMGSIAETALHDFVDITVFLILGAVLAAISRQVFTHNEVEDLSRNFPLLAILLMMGLAIVLCLCSEADAFVAASFSTMRPSAKLAFLVLGPMLDFKLYFMYTRVFRPRLIWTIITSVVIQVLVYSLITHFIWENYAGPALKAAAGTP